MIDRRQLLTGIAATGCTLVMPNLALSASATRILDLYRGDRKIGTKSLSVTRNGSRVDVSVDIDIDVRILGIPAYAYSLQSREVWDGGRLLGLEGRTNDNGTRESVSAKATSNGLSITGSGYSGAVRGPVGTTTYWTQAFLNRGVWISTQSGEPLNVSASRIGTEAFPTADGAVQATRWAVRGDIGKLDLFYDANGEWIGNEFTAKGEQARFIMRQRGGNLASLWAAA